MVLRHEDRTGRRLRVVNRVRLQPGGEGGPILGPEATLEERCRFRVALRLRLQPEPERRRVVDALLAAEGRVPVLGRPVRVRQRVEMGLTTIPARSLVAAPGGGDRDEGKQYRLADLDQGGAAAQFAGRRRGRYQL